MTRFVHSGHIGISLASRPERPARNVRHFGRLFTFNRPMFVGWTCCGEPYVVADRAFTVTVPESPLDSAGYRMNGTMRRADIEFWKPGAKQGFDQIHTYGSKASLAYDAAVNLGLAAPVAYGDGDADCLVSSVRLPGVVATGTPPLAPTQAYGFLFVVPEPLPPGSFAPPICGPHQLFGRDSDLDFSVLRSLAPYSGAPTRDDALAGMPVNTPYWTAYPEQFRRTQLNGENSEGYSGGNSGIGARRARALIYLHTNASNEDKLEVARRVVRHGINVYGAMLASTTGYKGSCGAGQFHGYVGQAMFAAFLLQNQTMLDFAKTIRSNATDQYFTVSAGDVGSKVNFPVSPESSNHRHITYLPSRVGIPEWNTQALDMKPPGKNGNANMALSARYRLVTMSAAAWELLPILLLRNGPGGATGESALLSHDGARRAAAIAYHDRIAAVSSIRFAGTAHQPGAQNLWRGAWRDQISTPRWTGLPEQINPDHHHTDFTVTAGAGSITFNDSALAVSALPVTRRDVRVSLDNTQWIQTDNVPANHTLTGLTGGLPHYYGIRHWNGFGAGEWGITFRPDAAGYYTVTPSGTPAGAPTVSVDPIVCYRPFPRWNADWFEPCPASLPSGVDTLHAGNGYYSGGAPITIGYQWKRGGAAISGETERAYSPVLADAGASLTCDVTFSNGSGSVTRETNAVAVPAADSPVATYRPRGTSPNVPALFVREWLTTGVQLEAVGPGHMLYSGYTDSGDAAHSAARLTELYPMGDLSALTEGDCVLEHSATTNTGDSFVGVVIYGAGSSAATATGFILQRSYNSANSWKPRITKVVSGARTHTTGATITDTSLTEQSDEEKTYSYAHNMRWYTRFNWRVNGDNRLEVRLKSWPRDLLAGEPDGWQYTWTDTAAPPADGWFGLGSTRNRQNQNVFGLGLSNSADTPAPLPGTL